MFTSVYLHLNRSAFRCFIIRMCEIPSDCLESSVLWKKTGHVFCCVWHSVLIRWVQMSPSTAVFHSWQTQLQRNTCPSSPPQHAVLPTTNGDVMRSDRKLHLHIWHSAVFPLSFFSPTDLCICTTFASVQSFTAHVRCAFIALVWCLMCCGQASGQYFGASGPMVKMQRGYLPCSFKL